MVRMSRRRWMSQYEWNERGGVGNFPHHFFARGWIETLRSRREKCESVRMENAAKRNKLLPKVYRRAMRMAAAAAEARDKKASDSSMPADTEASVVDDELGEDDARTPVEVGRDAETETDTNTETEKAEPWPVLAGSKLTAKSQHQHDEADAKKAKQQREAKSWTGPKAMIAEGVTLASDADVARIHAANRKAWPRGQEPIAAAATAEDREIAELVRRGFIRVEDLQVDRDESEEDVCLYTVRFVEGRKKGRKGNSHRQKGVQVAGHARLDAESDWWYLDDEAFSQLLSDGGAELLDWSEASSFVYVD